jgi:hypothetical protein
MAHPLAPGGPGCYSVTGLAVRLAVRLLAAELKVFAALATDASFFLNPALGPISSFQARRATMKVCF